MSMAVLVPLKQRTSQLLPDKRIHPVVLHIGQPSKVGQKSSLAKHTGTLASLEHEVRGRILLLRLHILQQKQLPFATQAQCIYPRLVGRIL